MRILGIERGDTACDHYRVLQPLYKLLEHDMARILTLEEGATLGTDWALQKLLESDIVVVHRPASEEWFKFIKTCRKNGKIVVCDYDDDPFNTHPLNPYYQFIGTEEVKYVWSDGTEEMLWSKNPAEHGGRYLNIEQNIRRRDLFRASFKSADLVTTTTDILAEKLRKINPNVAVLPNVIDFAMYPTDCEYKKKEIRIGWQGGSSHYEDLWMVKNAVKRILKKYSNTKFIFWGDARMYGLFREVPIARVECHPWMKHVVYPYKLSTLNLDIGLCPVTDNEFNRNKSAIKYFEYSVMKTPTVASNIPPYAPVIKDGEDGVLVTEGKTQEETDDAWFNAIEKLVLDEQLRTTIGRNAFDNVFKNHNADNKVHLWRDAYEKTLKKDLKDELHISKPTEQTLVATR